MTGGRLPLNKQTNKQATTNLDAKNNSAAAVMTFSNWTDLDSEDDDFFLLGFDDLLNTFNDNGTDEVNATLHRNFSTLQGILR